MSVDLQGVDQNNLPVLGRRSEDVVIDLDDESVVDSLPKIGYGDEIQIIVILKEPIKSRNPEEFDFAKYLKINDIDAVLLSYIFLSV